MSRPEQTFYKQVRIRAHPYVLCGVVLAHYQVVLFNASKFILFTNKATILSIIICDLWILLPMNSDTVDSFLTSCYLQNTKYLLIAPFAYREQTFEEMVLIYDKSKFKQNANLINEYKRITKLQLQLRDVLQLQVCASTHGRPQKWKPISEDVYIETWLNGEGLLQQKEIRLRFSVERQFSYLGESAYIVYGQNYFNSQTQNYEQLGFFIPHLNKVCYKKCRGNQRLLTYLKEIQELGEKYDIDAYELRVMKFSLKNVQIGPMIVINTINNETGERYIENKAMIEIRKKGYTSSEKNAINLRILGPNVSIGVNYARFRQFRCENICIMAGISIPESYCFEYKSSFIKNHEPLSSLRLQNYYPRSTTVLHINIVDQRSLFDYLLLQADLFYPQPDERILDKLESLHKSQKEYPKYSENILEGTNGERSKEIDFSRWLSFCTIGNRFLRDNTLPNKISESIRENPELSYIFTMTQILVNQPFSLSKRLNQTVHRLANYQISSNQGDILTFKNILSTSKSRLFAQSFIQKHDSSPRTTFQIKHYSGRSIQQFSMFKDEKEVLFAPFTKFIVREVKQEGNAANLMLEELPQVRNSGRRHVVWIGEDVDQVIQIVKTLRKKYAKKQERIDILPFKNNQMLETYYQHSPYSRIPKDRAIVVFSLSGTLQQREWRLKFIKQAFPASLYIYFSPNQQEKLSIEEVSPIVLAKSPIEVQANIQHNFFDVPMMQTLQERNQIHRDYICTCDEHCQLI